EPVERREERDAAADRAVLGVRMRDEAAAAKLDAERAEAALVDQPLRLAPRDALRLGVPALGEIPDALRPAAADDGDLAARRHALQHQPHLARTPPAVRLPRVPGVVLDLTREQRPAPFERAQDVAAVGGVLLQVGDDAAVERP